MNEWINWWCKKYQNLQFLGLKVSPTLILFPPIIFTYATDTPYPPLKVVKIPFLKPSLISHYLFFNFLLSTERKQCFWATRMMRKNGLKYGVFLASFENKFSTPNTCTILRKNTSFERGKHKFSFSLHFELQILCHNL